MCCEDYFEAASEALIRLWLVQTLLQDFRVSLGLLEEHYEAGLHYIIYLNELMLATGHSETWLAKYIVELAGKLIENMP